MFCTKCGHEIADGSAFCNKCGAPQRASTPQSPSGPWQYASSTGQPAVQKPKYNTMCIVGFVISCISLLLNFWGLVGIAGTVVSIIGLADSKNKHEQGNTLAIFGICIGVFSVVFAFIILSTLFI